jgi:hypothetical protein
VQSPPPPAEPPLAQPPLAQPPALDAPEISDEEEGPLANPAQTAAIIAVLGVLVMAVSVGAIAALMRMR